MGDGRINSGPGRYGVNKLGVDLLLLLHQKGCLNRDFLLSAINLLNIYLNYPLDKEIQYNTTTIFHLAY